MAIDGLDALETRIRSLVQLVQDLRHKNLCLEEEIRTARQNLEDQEHAIRRGEQERADIQSRIDKVLADIDVVDCVGEPEEVSL